MFSSALHISTAFLARPVSYRDILNVPTVEQRSHKLVISDKQEFTLRRIIPVSSCQG